MTLGGETDSSNPSRLIFSIKIPVSPRKETTFNIYSNLRTTERRDARSKKLLWTKKKVLSLFNLQKLDRKMGTNPVEVLPSPELHMTLINQEEHLWQDSFLLQLLADHQSSLQSTTNTSAVAHHLIQNNYYRAHKKTYKYLKMFRLRKKAFNSRCALH